MEVYWSLFEEIFRGEEMSWEGWVELLGWVEKIEKGGGTEEKDKWKVEEGRGEGKVGKLEDWGEREIEIDERRLPT